MFESLTINWLRYVILVIRESIFAQETPDEMDMVVDIEIEELERILGAEYFTNAEETSFYFRGEDLNMARPKYIDNEWKWYQTHIRAWEREDGLHLSIHQELDPTMYPQEHMNLVEYTKEPAVTYIEGKLMQYGHDVERLT